MWAFAAHTQLPLIFLYNILQKLLTIRLINFAKGAICTSKKLWQNVATSSNLLIGKFANLLIYLGIAGLHFLNLNKEPRK